MEYKVLRFTKPGNSDGLQRMQDTLNELAAEGWLVLTCVGDLTNGYTAAFVYTLARET